MTYSYIKHRKIHIKNQFANIHKIFIVYMYAHLLMMENEHLHTTGSNTCVCEQNQITEHTVEIQGKGFSSSNSPLQNVYKWDSSLRLDMREPLLRSGHLTTKGVLFIEVSSFQAGVLVQFLYDYIQDTRAP